MKLIKPSYEILEQESGLDGMYKQIEKVGRTCYKSEDKITKDSAKPFVDRMASSKHYAMLEHGTIYLTIPYYEIMYYVDPQNPYDRQVMCNPWTKYVVDYTNDLVYVSSNYRWIAENKLDEWLKYACEPTQFHERRICVKFTCDRGVSHEFVRHRVFSFAQESTRYCNYSKDKFDNELTFIIPTWTADLKDGQYTRNDSGIYRDNDIEIDHHNTSDASWKFVNSMLMSEHLYKTFLDYGWKAQEARNILPNALKTELVMTGFASDWKHFFDLRAYGVTGKPHPQASELAVPLLNEFIEKYLHGVR